MTELQRCRPWIEAALARSEGGYAFDDVVKELESGLMQFWPAQKGCAVTQILAMPQRKILHVFLAGGDLEQLIDMIESVSDWGRAQGCSAMTMSGRKGWSRRLPGWSETAITMEKAL